MHHARNQRVELFWTTGKNLGPLLIEAAGVVDKNDCYSEVHSHLDYESGDYEVMVYVYG